VLDVRKVHGPSRMTPSPARTTLRFSVQNPAGQRAATWKCSAPNTTDDVYLACREVDGTFKVSLHQSGEWNIAFTPSFYDRAVRDEDTTARGRFLDQWTRPAPIAPGVTLALRIVTPWSSVITPITPARRLVTIPAPTEGHAVETIIPPRSSRFPRGLAWPRFHEDAASWLVSSRERKSRQRRVVGYPDANNSSASGDAEIRSRCHHGGPEGR
jgi:hypothetical protein